jgi:GDP-mannose 6-dehydrogenase
MGTYSVFGLGYVGSTMVAGLTHQGHHVIGMDPDPAKLKAIESGASPVAETEISNRITEARDRGLIQVTGDTAEAMNNSEVAFICVGTPSRADGGIDLSTVRKVTKEVAKVLPPLNDKIDLVFRSTMIPGSMEGVVLPELGEYSRTAYYPEFMREGNAWEDWLHPPKIVIGTADSKVRTTLLATFPATHAPVFWTDFRTAEMVKYVDNAFHATKVTFANEIGIVAKEIGVDAAELMKIFVSDRKLNISETYLRPGFAFGGSCLRKDLRALTTFGKERGDSLPLLSGILESNEAQITRALHIISEKATEGPVGFIGLTFKAGTDDVRESPYLRLASEIWKSGVPVLCHDPDVVFEDLIGANLHHVKTTYPELDKAMRNSAEPIWKECKTVVIGRRSNFGSEPFVREFVKQGGYVVDLTANELLRNWCGNNYWSVV